MEQRMNGRPGHDPIPVIGVWVNLDDGEALVTDPDASIEMAAHVA